MRGFQLAAAGAYLLLGAGALCGEELQPDHTLDRWELTKLAVAGESVASDLRFFRSLRWWTPGNAGLESRDVVYVDGDATADTALPAVPAIHIRGNLATTLQVDGQSEVVVGGSILKNARIEADGITVIHVQGDVDGTISCSAMAAVWVRGSLRGEILTGAPGMHLNVGGDLLGTVRPISTPALLYIRAAGNAPTSILAAIDRYRYTELQIAAGTSDLAPGVHRLWTGSNGFVAVVGPFAGK
jgi:hypothetical protein